MRLVERVLCTHYSDWGVGSLKIIGSGLDFVVCRADSEQWGWIAIRIPRTRFIYNENDETVDSRNLLKLELFISRYMRKYSIPVPEVYHLHIDDKIDFLVSSFIENDQSKPNSVEMGKLVASIHQVPLIHIPYTIDNTPFQQSLVNRILRRSAVIRKHSGITVRLPNLHDLKRSLKNVSRMSILHMDIRPDNLLTYNNQMMGIVDWSNVLIGDPALEIARIAEYGLLTEEFLEGYGSSPLKEIPPVLEWIYRMDTAVMLAIVFLSEAPDPNQAKKQLNRVEELNQSYPK